MLAADFDQCVWGVDAREVWRALSEAGPVVTPKPGMVVVTTTPAVQQVLQDPGTFSSNPAAMFFGSDTGAIPLQVDPPEHSRYRKMLDPLFAPRRMAEREPELTVLANDLIDGFIERGHCDFSTEFAVPFPSAVFLRLMGLPLDRLDEFLVAKEGMIRPQADTEAERQALQAKTGVWIFEYFMTALETHSGDEDADVLGTFLALERAGRLTRDETLNICLLMLAAGLDTVTDTLECVFASCHRAPTISASSATTLSSSRVPSRSSCGSTRRCRPSPGSPPVRRRSAAARSEKVNGSVSCWQSRTTTLTCTPIPTWWTSGAR